MRMRAATVVQVLQDCFKFYCMFYCIVLVIAPLAHLVFKCCTVLSQRAALPVWTIPTTTHDRIKHVLLDRLHWLPVPQRVQYKLCSLTFKALHGRAPTYLADLFQPVASVGSWQRLRSATIGDLVTRPTSTYFGARSFAVAGPTIWNQLTADVYIRTCICWRPNDSRRLVCWKVSLARRSTKSVNSFKTVLKTFLFRPFADWSHYRHARPLISHVFVTVRKLCALRLLLCPVYTADANATHVGVGGVNRICNYN